MVIRTEIEEDRDAVSVVNLSAFHTPAEARLVDALRRQVESYISLVALQDERIVGHLMLSPVVLEGTPDLKLMGLAPMAVLPEFQRRGIGSALVRAGIQCCRDAEMAAIFVLGHPEFYPRFGFVSAARFGIDSEYDVPDDVFLVVELEPGRLEGTGAGGRVRYHAAFGEL